MNTDVRKVCEALRADIVGGAFSDNMPLPSLRTLATQYGVSVYTARQAVNELIHRNLVESRHGSGTYVTRRGLARKIGVVVPGIAYSDYFRPFVSRFVGLCERGGYNPIFRDDWPADPQKRAKAVLRFVRDLVKEEVAGIVFQPLEHFPKADYANRKIAAALDEAGVPLVLVDSDIAPPPDRSRYDVVSINNHDAGVRAAEHLLSLGVREIRFFLGRDADWNIANRMRGVASAVLAHGGAWTDRCVVEADPDDVAAVRRVLSSRPRPEAFVCRGDTTAMALAKTLGKLGKRIPEDVRLVGFDDVAGAAKMDPPLTTVRQPSDAIASVAFRTLAGRIAVPNLPPCEIYLPAPLVVRASTIGGVGLTASARVWGLANQSAL